MLANATPTLAHQRPRQAAAHGKGAIAHHRPRRRQLAPPSAQEARQAAAQGHAPSAPADPPAAGGESVRRTAPDTGPATDGTTAAVAALRARLEPAVLAELEEQRRQQADTYHGSAVKRLREDGLVLLGLRAQPAGRELSEFIWSLTPSHGGTLPYHRFRRGDTIVLAPSARGAASNGRPCGDGSSSDGDCGGLTAALEGTVQAVGQEEVRVAVSKDVAQVLGAAPAGARWRLDRGVSATSTQRQLAALARLGELHDTRCQGEAAVRAILLGSPQAEALAARPTTWAASREWRACAVRQLRQHTRHLNDSQAHAVASAMTRSFTLWRGPPGTGKTRTLLALVEVLVRAVADSAVRRSAQGAILAAADTNAAADNLLEGCWQCGIRAVSESVAVHLLARSLAWRPCPCQAHGRHPKCRVTETCLCDAAMQVRLGQPAKVRPDLRHACLEALVEGTPNGQRAARLRLGADDCLQRIRLAQLQQRSSEQQQADAIRDLQRKADELWRQADKLVAGEAEALLRRAPVVVATCNGAGSERLEGQRFRIVVLDEASQATEPSSFIPLVKGAECVVAAGDQRQLPPTVLSLRAKE